MAKRRVFLFIGVVVLCSALAGQGMADTIYTKDDKELKGIILEDYKDRVIFSTINGEVTIMKSDIKELYYDTEEQNLIKLGEQAKDKSDYIKAFIYYDRAFRINPNSKQAKDGIVFLQGFLFKKDLAQKEEVVRKHNDFEQFGVTAEVAKSDEEKFKGDIEKLKKVIGISLEPKGNLTEVSYVVEGSAAKNAGMQKGDLLIAVWGRLVGYMSLKEIMVALLEKASLETQCTVERTRDVAVSEKRSLLSNTKELIGATLTMQFDGLTILSIEEGGAAMAAGLKPEDIIVAINGNSTRYMPLKKAIELIKDSKDPTVRLIFRRDIVIWVK